MSQPDRNRRWIEVRRRYLSDLKSQVAEYHSVSGDLKRYHSGYERAFQRRWEAADVDRLMSSVLASNVVYGGDFHAYSQAQRTHLRLLRMIPKSRRVVLHMECFESQVQPSVDRFLRGKLSSKDFLSEIRWERRWGFPWSHYQPIIELARRRGWEVMAINKRFTLKSEATLRRRDTHSGRIIAEKLRKQPDAIHYVIYGDLHLAPSHLPQIVARKFKTKPSQVIIFQNSEKLYFRWGAALPVNCTQVLSGGAGVYCILNAPPWVKWQSYLLFLEGQVDKDLEESGQDYTDHLKSLVQFMAKDLGVTVDVDNLAVYGPESESLWLTLSKSLSKADLLLAEDLAQRGRHFFLPGRGIAYLARTTVNHAADLAGEYLQAHISGRSRVLWRFPGDFSKQIWVEALSYFASKLVNDRRKPENLEDLKRSAARQRAERDVLSLVLGFRIRGLMWASGVPMKRSMARARRRSSYLEASRFLGSILGEQIFSAYRARHITEKDVLDWLKADVEKRGFDRIFQGVVRRMEILPAWLQHRETRL